MQIGVHLSMGQKHVLYICFIFPFSFFMCNCNQAPWTDVLVSKWENVFLGKWVKCNCNIGFVHPWMSLDGQVNRMGRKCSTTHNPYQLISNKAFKPSVKFAERRIRNGSRERKTMSWLDKTGWTMNIHEYDYCKTMLFFLDISKVGQESLYISNISCISAPPHPSNLEWEWSWWLSELGPTVFSLTWRPGGERGFSKPKNEVNPGCIACKHGDHCGRWWVGALEGFRSNLHFCTRASARGLERVQVLFPICRQWAIVWRDQKRRYCQF